MRRLTGSIRRLEERRQSTRSYDRECLAAAYRCEAADALSRDDYAACMYNCLCGIDVLPAYSLTCHAEDFLTLINRTKGADADVYSCHNPGSTGKDGRDPGRPYRR